LFTCLIVQRAERPNPLARQGANPYNW